ncbi:hypothetical protein [Comamonas testosteroni]|uniref:hypothetical protein n=1 Tax=Comamonas testosteroni TaxID=285 RepID=UPI0005B4C990|nr:hypothetical protein [Comamonas testosteroni]
MTHAIDITSLVQTLASCGVPSAQLAQVRELGKKAEQYAEIFDAARDTAKAQNCGTPSSHDDLVSALRMLAIPS